MKGVLTGCCITLTQGQQEHAIAEERGHAAAAQAQLAEQLQDVHGKLAEARSAAQQGSDRAAELAGAQQRSEALIAKLQVLRHNHTLLWSPLKVWKCVAQAGSQCTLLCSHVGRGRSIAQCADLAHLQCPISSTGTPTRMCCFLLSSTAGLRSKSEGDIDI